jgi:hypothetical protein
MSVPRLARLLAWGAGVGGLLGSLFALAVVSFADCAGAHCAEERVVGLLGHAAAGAVVGAAAGAVVYGLGWAWRRVRR